MSNKPLCAEDAIRELRRRISALEEHSHTHTKLKPCSPSTYPTLEFSKFELKQEVESEVKRGGDWLAAGRTWIKSNVRNGDTLTWGSTELVSVPFDSLHDLMLQVAVAAVTQERIRAGTVALRAKS